IEGLGEKNVELLLSKGLIKHFIDIYKLKKDDLLTLPRFAEKSAENLIDAIEKSKETTLARFLYALGIPHVGEYAARLLAKNFRDLKDLYHVGPGKISSIRQMGEKIARSVSDFFNDGDGGNIETLEEMQRLGIRVSNPDYESEKHAGRPLEGLTFVITGTLPRPRKEVEELISSLGGHAASSVSGSTDYLLVGENPGSKLKKAESLGVRSLSYAELMELIEGKS
ncbi:MAG TPA: NAD-dependent DNA ligase LigA, partial [Nitrospirae bacterium]|nr:NAD-dependent DNA ligase LigA [Nitrospirota bacterium]